MMKRDRRTVWVAGLMTALAGGCTGADQSVLGTFVCDLMASALAAFLF